MSWLEVILLILSFMLLVKCGWNDRLTSDKLDKLNVSLLEHEVRLREIEVHLVSSLTGSFRRIPQTRNH